MKKLLPLFMLVILFSGCEKAILKRTTVKIISDDMLVTVDFPNDAEKYFAGLSNEQVKSMFISEFEKELGKGKIDIVNENPDYIIRIKQVDFSEFVVTEYEDGHWYDLSRVGVHGVYEVTNSMEDVPGEHVVTDVIEETLETNKKKKNKYHKGGGSVYVTGIDDLNYIFTFHAGNARKEFKSIFKQNQ